MRSIDGDIVIASLGKNDYGLGHGGGSRAGRGLTVFRQGFPFDGPTEPHVAAQWVFDESSGSIVDKVASLTLTVNGAPTYSSALSGAQYARISPGIDYSASANNYHQKLTASTALNIGASDHVVIEWWYKATGGLVHFTTHVTDTVVQGISFAKAPINNVAVQFNADDATTLNIRYTKPSNLDDGNPHKFRIRINRSGDCDVYFDGSLLSNVDPKVMSSLSGKTFTNTAFHVPGSGLGDSITGVIYCFRISIGTDVLSNNHGGPNGG